MNTIIKYFLKNHLLVNLITVVVLLTGVLAWQHTKKEELPDITFSTIRITTNYSGASADDIEFYITDPIEENLQGITHIEKITSNSSPGISVITVELDTQNTDKIDRALTEIQNRTLSTNLPDDLRDDPNVRLFETSKKAIIDIALYNEDKVVLDTKSRQKLQSLARSLENQLTSRPEIFEVRKSGYLEEELTIKVNPKRMTQYEIPLSTIATEIQRSHTRAPAGTLRSGSREQVSIRQELNTAPKLKSIAIEGSFDSAPIPLRNLATIEDNFELPTTITKVNGREAIMMNIVKTSDIGILDALEITKKVAKRFQETALKNTPIKLTYLDDESIDLRNRLTIITTNGLLGFILIAITLLIFLNKRAGFWVAIGIPFSLCFTLLSANLLGYTINGITLAAIIIVLGIVVDDAIIVAENISRKLNEGLPLQKAAYEGTTEVMAPIIASILTTCAAFIPLLLFTGRYANFVKHIPPIIFLMLFASLLESFLLLPSHMTLIPKSKSSTAPSAKKWFETWEKRYANLLEKLLPKRYLILGLMILSIILVNQFLAPQFKFVMFPREESREIVLSGKVPSATTPQETAIAITKIEDYLTSYINGEGVAVRSIIARGRRGATARENQFETTLESSPKTNAKSPSTPSSQKSSRI